MKLSGFKPVVAPSCCFATDHGNARKSSPLWAPGRTFLRIAQYEVLVTGSCPFLRALTTSTGGDDPLTTKLSSDSRRLENLWRDFFLDPSQWWDHRSDKVSAKYPDFTHKKKTQQALWLRRTRNPTWVESKLATIAPGVLNPNPISWNTKLARYVKGGQDVKALELFQEMQRQGIVPDTFTFVQVLHACANMQSLDEGRRIHGQVIESECELDVFVGSSLINMYGKCGSPDEGRVVFDKMPIRNVVVWNAMIQGYARCAQADKALELSLLMQMELVEPDKNTFASIINACTAMKALEEGRRVHAQIIERSLESNSKLGTSLVVMYAKCGSMEEAQGIFNKLPDRILVAWKTMIMGYLKSGQGQRALELFHQMEVDSVEPDMPIFAGVLSACASIGSHEEGRWVHALVVEKGLDSDVSVGNALVDMYSKCGNAKDATRVFNKMPSRNVISWTAMLAGYAMHGQAKETLELFEEMCQERIEMDWTVFYCLLSACSHAGLLEKGLHYFQSMISIYGLVPRAEHYVCIVDLLGRAGRLEEAEDMIKRMSCEPNVYVWKALLGACRVHGNVLMGERCTRQILRLGPKRVSNVYVMLSNVYAAALKWDGSFRPRESKVERVAKKQAGYAWIVLNDKVDSFIVDDHTHPQISEIHTKLSELSAEMEKAGYVPDSSFMVRDVEEEERGHHGQKLAIAYGLISTPPTTPLRIYKNFRVCNECHTATKFISKIVEREIIVRDANRFHHFKDGSCSCGDYW